MSASNGQISYGYVFEEGHEFPWDDEKYDGNIDGWWEDVRGFKGTAESPYDEFGGYKEGFHSRSPEVSKYFQERQEWHKANPLPVELVNYCSEDCPMFILASKHMEANRGYPNGVQVGFLQNTEEAHERLQNFMEEFEIEPEGEVGWWLSSYKE